MISSEQNFLQEFSFQFMMEEPIYGNLFAYFPKVWDHSVTQLTFLPFQSTNIQLAIHPYFLVDIQKQDDWYSTLADKVKHELLHLFSFHPFQINSFKQTDVYHAATDLYIDKYLGHSTTNTFTAEHFPTLSFNDCKNLNDFYQLLNQAQNTSPEIKRPFIDYPQFTLDHKAWLSYSQLSNGQIDFLHQKLKTLYQQVFSKNKAQINSSTKTILFEKLYRQTQQTKKVNWKVIIQQFAARTNGSKLIHSIHRPSKRYGTTPGIKIKSRKKLLIAIDTSGSINQKQLNVFYQEVHRLWQLNMEIQIIECDYEIRNQFNYTGSFPEVRAGGYRTDFTPPIQFANEQFRPAGILYFTDGEGACPRVKSRCPVLWVIVGDADSDYKHLPGQKIFLL